VSKLLGGMCPNAPMTTVVREHAPPETIADSIALPVSPLYVRRSGELRVVLSGRAGGRCMAWRRRRRR